MFGPQLILDLYGCEEEKISNKKLIYKLLYEMPELINLRKISKPIVFYIKENERTFDKGGISGFVLIAESHITIHTFSGYGYAFVDIFSCKDFDYKKIIEYLKENLKAKKIKKRFFIRGREFPKEKFIRVVLKDRKNLAKFA